MHKTIHFFTSQIITLSKVFASVSLASKHFPIVIQNINILHYPYYCYVIYISWFTFVIFHFIYGTNLKNISSHFLYCLDVEILLVHRAFSKGLYSQLYYVLCSTVILPGILFTFFSFSHLMQTAFCIKFNSGFESELNRRYGFCLHKINRGSLFSVSLLLQCT